MGIFKDLLLKTDLFEDSNSKSGSKQKANDPPKNTTQNTPAYFPVQPQSNNTNQPSFVVGGDQSSSQGSNSTIDPTFIKYFEDMMAKSNLPGVDYFEFRELLLKTQKKMQEKGVNSRDAVLQAVLLTLDAQGVTATMLAEHAKHYKQIINTGAEQFVTDAKTEKEKQLNLRENTLKKHQESIQNLQNQMTQLEVQRTKFLAEMEAQKSRLNDSLQKEMTQLELDKNLGEEMIKKIDRSCESMKNASQYMTSSIDEDITTLQRG